VWEFEGKQRRIISVFRFLASEKSKILRRSLCFPQRLWLSSRFERRARIM
jgi:hypothetical protein